MARLKNQTTKKNGRPPLPEMSLRQSVMRTKLLNKVEPYFEAALEKVATLAGISRKEKGSEKPKLIIEDKTLPLLDEDGLVIEQPKADTKLELAACKIVIDLYSSSIKEVYLKDGAIREDTTQDTESQEKPKAKVSQLHLTVQS